MSGQVEDYQHYLSTYYDRPRVSADAAGIDSIDRMREHMRAQRNELHELGARLNGLRYILSLSGSISQDAAGSSASASGLYALQRLLDAMGEPPPPVGVPPASIDELMPKTRYADYVRSSQLRAFAPERIQTECSVCLDEITADQVTGM